MGKQVEADNTHNTHHTHHTSSNIGYLVLKPKRQELKPTTQANKQTSKRKKGKKGKTSHTMADFESAKAFLMEASDHSGLSVYEHLSGLVTKLLDERPQNAADMIEQLSYQLKSDKFAPSDILKVRVCVLFLVVAFALISHHHISLPIGPFPFISLCPQNMCTCVGAREGAASLFKFTRAS